jgi:hypothetical protein
LTHLARLEKAGQGIIMETSKVHTLRGRRFRIDMMSARDGSWILHQTLNKRMPLGLDKQLPGLDATRPDLTEAEFHVIQDKVLGTVSELVEVPGTTESAAKRIFEDGRFTVPHIENDPNLVYQLTQIAFVHTVTPFFIDRDSKSGETGK